MLVKRIAIVILATLATTIVPFVSLAEELQPPVCELPKTDKQFGARGADVKCLQEFLISKGNLESGNNTGYFGKLTRAGLAQFQKINNITPAVGYFGPKTRAAAKTITINPLTIAPIAENVAPIFLPVAVVAADDTASPTGAIPAGASSVILAKLKFHASSEAVKIKFIDVTLTQRASPTENWTTTASTFTDDFANLRIADNVGGQMGNAISTLSSDAGAGTTGKCTVTSTTVLTCHFGGGASPINYTIPANTTRVFSIISDIGSSTDLNTVSAAFAAGTDNVEGQTSFVSTIDSGAVSGATRTVVTSSLTAGINSAFSSPSYGAGLQDIKIASFILTASAAQSATVYSLTFDKDTNADFDLQNMLVKVGETQFGSTRPLVGNTETNLSFSGVEPIIVTAGNSVTVDVYADLMATTVDADYSSAIDLIGWSANGSTGGGTIAFSGAVNGQTVTVGSSGTLTIGISSMTPPAKQVIMGTPDVELATFSMKADGTDDVYISDITLYDTMTNANSTASFEHFTLWAGGEMIGGPVVMTDIADDTGTIYFEFIGDGIYIPKNSATNVTLKGDAISFNNGSATNSQHVFTIADNADVSAFPANPVGETTVTGAPIVSATITVYRTKLTLSAVTVIDSATDRTRKDIDNLAQITFSNNGENDLTISTVIVDFAGMALAGEGALSFDVSLPSFGSSVNPTTCTTSETNTCSVTFSPDFILSGNATKNVKVRVNSTNFFNATSSMSEGLSVFLSGTTSVLWNDGTTGALPLEASAVPFTIANVTYN